MGRRVKRLRKGLRLEQADLAAKIGLSQPKVSLIENDKLAPGPTVIARLALALHTTADYLLGLSPDSDPRA
jgi:transcriptional regulator with XRE-family HTH domain